MDLKDRILARAARQRDPRKADILRRLAGEVEMIRETGR